MSPNTYWAKVCVHLLLDHHLPAWEVSRIVFQHRELYEKTYDDTKARTWTWRHDRYNYSVPPWEAAGAIAEDYYGAADYWSFGPKLGASTWDDSHMLPPGVEGAFWEAFLAELIAGYRVEPEEACDLYAELRAGIIKLPLTPPKSVYDYTPAQLAARVAYMTNLAPRSARGRRTVP